MHTHFTSQTFLIPIVYSPQTRLNTSNPEQELPLAHAPHMSCTDSAANVMTTHALARQTPPRQITPGDTRSGATVLDGFNDNEMTALCFIDLSKCFDTIDHTILVKKLHMYGITYIHHP